MCQPDVPVGWAKRSLRVAKAKRAHHRGGEYCETLVGTALRRPCCEAGAFGPRLCPRYGVSME